MRLHELEAWTLDIVNRVRAGTPVEDDRVELKAEFVDPAKAARRLAGHANAARGASVLWVIGVDEGAGTVPGVDAVELAAWWAATKAWFSEWPPEIQHLSVPVGAGTTVVALLLETERAPFVVRNPSHGKPGGGPVELEVPWREGTAIRSARRSDLLRLLVPAVQRPVLEVLDAGLRVFGLEKPEDIYGDWADRAVVHASFYIEYDGSSPLIIPEHRAFLELVSLDGLILHRAVEPRLRVGGVPTRFTSQGFVPETVAQTIERGASQLIVHSHGHMEVSARLPWDEPLDIREDEPVALVVQLEAVGADLPIRASVEMRPAVVTQEPRRHGVHAEWVKSPDHEAGPR